MIDNVIMTYIGKPIQKWNTNCKWLDVMFSTVSLTMQHTIFVWYTLQMWHMYMSPNTFHQIWLIEASGHSLTHIRWRYIHIAGKKVAGQGGIVCWCNTLYVQSVHLVPLYHLGMALFIAICHIWHTYTSQSSPVMSGKYGCDTKVTHWSKPF